MPVRISQYNDDPTISLYQVQGQWSLEEIIEAKIAFEADNPPPPEYFIVDMRDAGMVPDGFLANRQQVMEYFNAPDVLNIVVGGNRLLQWLANMLQRLGLVSPFVFVDSIQAAEAHIRQHQEQRVR